MPSGLVVLYIVADNDCHWTASFKRECSALTSVCERQLQEMGFFVLWAGDSISTLEAQIRSEALNFILNSSLHRVVTRWICF